MRIAWPTRWMRRRPFSMWRRIVFWLRPHCSTTSFTLYRHIYSANGGISQQYGEKDHRRNDSGCHLARATDFKTAEAVISLVAAFGRLPLICRFRMTALRELSSDARRRLEILSKGVVCLLPHSRDGP